MGTPKFKGSLAEFQAVVSGTGCTGQWVEKQEGHHQFRCSDGGIMNWWPSRGTITFQGDGKRLEAIILSYLHQNSSVPPANVDPVTGSYRLPVQRQIFVVHGHDKEALDQLELALHRLELKPFILMNTSGEGKTIIEALEGQIGRDYKSDFGIVLLTPDDVGYSKAEGEQKSEDRARQNVILETGMLLASLTRQRMAIIVKGHVDIPSDLEGVIRWHYNQHIREVVPKLCTRLAEVGIPIDQKLISSAAS